VSDVRTYIDKLNVNKSTGNDGIGPRILKACGDSITIPIANIINNSIKTGIFPDKLKEACVVPLHKNGPKDNLGNYRPISLLPTLSKIFEKHIADQLHSFIQRTNAIHDSQSGFRKHHSCQTALIRLVENWLKNLDEGEIIGTLFIDLKKAFDLVDHKILLYKLKLYNFSDQTLHLFQSYLTNRVQVVKDDDIVSEKQIIISGVPQGSILGPLLFIFYVNDIHLYTKDASVDMYADDTTMYKSHKNIDQIEYILQYNIDRMNVWCQHNNMAINPLKSTCMLIQTK